jgi:hypothetical protein
MKARNVERMERQRVKENAQQATTTPDTGTTPPDSTTDDSSISSTRLRPAGRNSHTVIENIRRIGTYQTANF